MTGRTDEEENVGAEPGTLDDGLGSAARRVPILSWRDANGEHQHRLEQRTVLGSADKADVVITDPTVSRLHVELDLRDDGLWARDLQSKNGTYVSGIAIESASVPDGTRLRVGGTEISVAYEKDVTPRKLHPSGHFGPLIGRSIVMRELFARLARVASTDSTVLVQGETGTGKELVAQAIHEASSRAGGPFIVVDCAALPENLIESELFGHVKGAFTGADRTRDGALEEANGGTVFLDEIGELPLAVQPKLLRAIESRTVRRIGDAQPRKIDVRFVSATHRDLRTMVNTGAFREDLYFRLAVVPVEVPPLRARLEDLPMLVDHFLPRGAGRDAVAAATPELLRRPWLGNVRELRNFVERVIALGTTEALRLTPGAVASHAALHAAGGEAKDMQAAGAAPGQPPAMSLDLSYKENRDRWLDHLERMYVAALLEQHKRNVSAVAHAAKLDRTYVHRLIKKHGL